MSKNLNLRKGVINQLINSIEQGLLDSPLPSQSILADLYNVSRTTIRHAIHYLLEVGILSEKNNEYEIQREIVDTDRLSYIHTKRNSNHLQRMENFFQTAIQKKEINPNDEFSELEFARKADVDVFTVREYFIQFSRFNLIKKLDNDKWRLIELTPYYADKLFELREMLECHALNCFMNLPNKDLRWMEIKVLLQEHRFLQEHIMTNYTDFSKLDHKLHTLILSAADNPFINDFIELLSVVFHFHYQWDNRDLRTRNILATEEHIALLMKIIIQDNIGALTELRQHLQTAKKTLMNSITKKQ